MAAYVTGASLLVHGGGERPAFLDAATVNHDGNHGDPAAATAADPTAVPTAEQGEMT